jgi:hypothetical protein
MLSLANAEHVLHKLRNVPVPLHSSEQVLSIMPEYEEAIARFEQDLWDAENSEAQQTSGHSVPHVDSNHRVDGVNLALAKASARRSLNFNKLPNSLGDSSVN